jgi:hypothetical protein
MIHRATVALAVLVALSGVFAATAAAADSVKILGASPQSGAFPVSPASGQVRVAYLLQSAPYAAIVAGPALQKSILQVGPDYHNEEAWVSKGSGEVVVSYTIVCGPETPPAPVDEISASLLPAQALHGTLGNYSAEDTLHTQGTWGCNPPPDITVPKHSGIVIGTKPVTWGGSVGLTSAEAAGAKGGACLFDTGYEMVNAGGSATMNLFTNRLAVDTPMNAVWEPPVNFSLHRNETKKVGARIPLRPGFHILYLVLDSNPIYHETESNESNNQFQVTYTLTGNCGGGLH